MFHHARRLGWLLTFVPAKPVSTLHPAGWLLSESRFGGRLHQICAAGQVRPNASPGLGQLQFSHPAKSGFRLSPGAYTLPYSPKTASTAAKPPQ
jgi:hypothetical protein